MSAPHSYDLRRKAITAVKRGKRKMDVSQMFNISRNTLDLWLNREAATGECRAITHFQTGCRHKITDWERFRKFAQHHGDKTKHTWPSCGTLFSQLLAEERTDFVSNVTIKKGYMVYFFAKVQS